MGNGGVPTLKNEHIGGYFHDTGGTPFLGGEFACLNNITRPWTMIYTILGEY